MYIKIVDGLPAQYSIQSLRKDNQDVSFPREIPDHILAEFDVYPVISVEQPTVDSATQVVERNGFVYNEDMQQWETAWAVRNKSPDELATALARLQQQIVAATQQRLDDFAKTRNYDGILSACTYASSAVQKFATEGTAAIQLRDATWSTLYQILAEVQAGTRPVPSGFADIEGDLPVLSWPE